MNSQSSDITANQARAEAPRSSVILGSVAPGFERVRDQFERSFREGRELGAAVAVYRDGERVVDLWGGVRDRASSAPWEADTMALLFSCTKGLAAMVTALAHSRGWLDFDAPVSDYWPEFAQGGKGGITVRQLLAHQAGLSAVDQPLTQALLSDRDALAEVLARQVPAWKPGSRCGYHPLTIGLYQSELIRRVDPQRRTIGQILQAEIAQPLAADVHIGVPDAIRQERLAQLVRGGGLADTFGALRGSLRLTLEMLLPGSLTYRTFMNPRGLTLDGFQERAWLKLELSAANGVASARGLAQAYGAFARGDARLALAPATLAQLAAPPRVPPGGGRDTVLFIDTAYSLGFWKPCRALPFGRNDSVFGAPGAGGSFAFADPSAGIGFAYIPNRMGRYVDDPRSIALRNALYQCLDELP